MPSSLHSDSPFAESRLLRVILVDDERLARKYLRQLLGEHPAVSIVGEADSVPSAAELARELAPDVIFLDVQMPPSSSGFDLLPLLDPAPAIVFVTAHDEFAVRAFAASATDYLLKPVTTKRLALALEHARRDRRQAIPEEPVGSSVLGLDDMLILRDTGRLRRVRMRDVAALVAEGSYTRVYLSGERSMLVLRSMTVWERLLPTPPFLRADRSLIINLKRVADLVIRSRDGGMLRLEAEDAPTFELGRVAITRLRAALVE